MSDLGIHRIFLRRFVRLIFASAVFYCTLLSQASNYTYYGSISPSNSTFVTDLHNLINNHHRITYDNYDETNVANFASRDTTNGQKVVTCVYSGLNYVYTPPFKWYGTAGVNADSGFSREHTWCQSWMPSAHASNFTSLPEYSDQYHIFPTNQIHANGVRSNHPEGNVVTVSSSYLQCKFGTDANTKPVFEPRASHKGDCARALLYMAVCYNGVNGYDWSFTYLNHTLDSLSEAHQDLSLLLQWSKDDPPDAWEVSRNNYVQSIQFNRNPFVDHPEWVNYIDFSTVTLSGAPPTLLDEPTNHLTNLSISSSSSSTLDISWTNATGSTPPSGYLVEIFSSDDYFVPIDGSTYADDINLSDDRGIKNIGLTGSYQFTGLTSGKTYYVHVYPYNGTGTQINYKIDGTVPSGNAATIAGTLAAEPTNYVTSFTSGAVTSDSIQLTWTDAVGSQLPSAYLLMANTTNVFSSPSDGATYSDDANLADGNAVVNIAYPSSGSYIFSGLESSTTYYFKIYSYNGSAGQQNYKTNGTPPTASCTTNGTGLTSNGTIDFGTTTDGTTATVTNTEFGGVRLSNGGGGGFTIRNPGQSIGTDAELQGVAPSTGSINSVGITSAEYGVATNVFTIKFEMYLSGGSSGTWSFFAGNGTSFSATQSSGFTGAQVFTGIQFIFGSSNSITTNNRSGSAWNSTGITGTPFSQNTAYRVDIVGNNSSSTVTYGSNSVAANTYDLFVNDVLVANDLPKGLLPATTNINAFRFYGESSTGNVATIALDNIVWYNFIDAGIPLPVELVAFTAIAHGSVAELNWITATEVNNYGFEVERKSIPLDPPLQGGSRATGEAGGFQKVAFVEGHGTTNAPQSYSYTDNTFTAGAFSYRLKQIDRDGVFQYSNSVEITAALTADDYHLAQNFPNPFNPSTTIRFAVKTPQRVSLNVYNMLGQEVRTLYNQEAEAGVMYAIPFDGSGLSSGVYYYRLRTADHTELKKMVMMK